MRCSRENVSDLRLFELADLTAIEYSPLLSRWICVARLGATAVSFLDHPEVRLDSYWHGA